MSSIKTLYVDQDDSQTKRKKCSTKIYFCPKYLCGCL